jgi:hypothetical protein
MTEALLDLLRELEEYFDNRSDINGEGGPNPEMRYHQQIAEVLDKHAASVPVRADPTWCSCPRYPNGGRKEPDPTCPLHAGDPRD